MSKSTKEILESYRLDKQYLEELNNDVSMFEQIKQPANNIDLSLLYENLKALILKLSNKISKIENVIDSLNQPYKNILYYKYVKNLSHNKIAMKMDYSLQRIFQLQKEALVEFSKIYKEDTN